MADDLDGDRGGVAAIIDREILEQQSCECYSVVHDTYERLLPDG